MNFLNSQTRNLPLLVIGYFPKTKCSLKETFTKTDIICEVVGQASGLNK